MDTRVIANYVVETIKKYEQRNKQEAEAAKLNPYEHRYFRKINYDIDYKYLVEVIEDGFNCGMFVVPENENELSHFANDIYTNFIEAEVFPSHVIFLRDESGSYYSKPTLARMVERYKSGEKFPYPEFRLKLNLGEIYSSDDSKINEEIENGVYCGCSKFSRGYKYFGDKNMSTWTYDNNYSMPFSDYFFKKSNIIKGKINIQLKIPSSVNLDNKAINYILEFLDKAKTQSKFDIGEVTLSFDQRNIDSDKIRYRYDNVTLNNLNYLSNYVSQLGGELYFSEFNEDFNSKLPKWNFEQLKKANTCINELAEYIKTNNLSPLEAVLFISAWCTQNLKYNKEGTDLELNNTIISAVNTNLVRCVGYSEFVNAVLNAAGFENTKNDGNVLIAKKISCTTEKDSNGNIIPNHCQSLIYIEDKKYGISGNYICDANAPNFMKIVTEQINKVLNDVSAKIPSIKPFNSLCLKSFDEYRAILPNYTIFPYAGSDEAYIEYDRQVSVGDISKLLRVQKSLASKSLKEVDEFLKNNNINFSLKPQTVNGVKYDEYMKQSKSIMKEIRKSQGKAINSEIFNEAYLKILPLIYPELAENKELLSMICVGFDLQNQTVTRFIQSSLQENEFEISTN